MTTIANRLVEQRAYLLKIKDTLTLPPLDDEPSFDGCSSTELVAIDLIKQMIRDGAPRNALERVFDKHQKNQLKRILAEEQNETLDQIVPQLPPNVKANQERAHEASPILDEMIKFFEYWCTRSYSGYHEAVAIWVLSAIAARRVVLKWRNGVWTPLYIMLVSDSTSHAKTEAASYGRRIIEACGLDFLLSPDDISPQKLMLNMSGSRMPRNYSCMTDEEKSYLHLKIAFSGQRGWIFDEFGNKLQEIVQAKGGYNAMFYALIKRLYDCKKTYEYDTVSHDNVHIDMPSLSILGTATPGCIKPITGSESAIWTDGTMARIVFCVPPKDELKLQSAPNDEAIVPQRVITSLQHWHERLGIPACEIVDIAEQEEMLEEVYGKDNKRKKEPKKEPYEIRKGELPQQEVFFSNDVYAAHDAYYRALAETIHVAGLDERFKSTYGRLPEKALRIAMLLASLENDGHMDMRHWARGQQIVENWRHDFHELITQLSSDESGYGATENMIIRAIATMTQMASAREISQASRTLKKIGIPKVREALEELHSAKVIDKQGQGKNALYGPKGLQTHAGE